MYDKKTGIVEIGADTTYEPKLTYINPGDRNFYDNSYIIALGVYGWTRVLVYASDFCSALEEAGDWARKHAPGFVTSPQEADALARDWYVDEHGEEPGWIGASDEERWEAYDHALEGHTALDGGYYLTNEITILSENPTRVTRKAYDIGYDGKDSIQALALCEVAPCDRLASRARGNVRRRYTKK